MAVQQVVTKDKAKQAVEKISNSKTWQTVKSVGQSQSYQIESMIISAATGNTENTREEREGLNAVRLASDLVCNFGDTGNFSKQMEEIGACNAPTYMDNKAEMSYSIDEYKGSASTGTSVNPTGSGTQPSGSGTGSGLDPLNNSAIGELKTPDRPRAGSVKENLEATQKVLYNNKCSTTNKVKFNNTNFIRNTRRDIDTFTTKNLGISQKEMSSFGGNFEKVKQLDSFKKMNVQQQKDAELIFNTNNIIDNMTAQAVSKGRTKKVVDKNGNVVEKTGRKFAVGSKNQQVMNSAAARGKGKSHMMGTLIKGGFRMEDDDFSRTIHKVESTIQMASPMLRATRAAGSVTYKAVAGMGRGVGTLVGKANTALDTLSGGAVKAAEKQAVNFGKQTVRLVKSVPGKIASAASSKITNVSLRIVNGSSSAAMKAVGAGIGKIPQATGTVLRAIGKPVSALGRGTVSAVKNLPSNLSKIVDATTSTKAMTSAVGNLAHAGALNIKNFGRGAANKIVHSALGEKVFSSPAATKILTGLKSAKGTAGAIKTGIGKVFSAVASPFRAIASGISGAIDFVKKKVMSLIGYYAAIALSISGVVIIVCIACLTVVIVLTSVVDAISDTLEAFKTNTTMGGAYQKLLDEEQNFNSALLSVSEDKTALSYLPDGVPSYTNITIHYLGADGNELSWNSAGYVGAYTGTVSVPNETAEEIWNILYNEYHVPEINIAGLIGNIAQECDFNYASNVTHSDGHKDVGLFQWTDNAKCTRYTQFFNWCNANNKKWDSLETQLEYLFAESDGYGNIAAAYCQTKFSSPTDAAMYFCNAWERPSAPVYERRVAEAEAAYAAYGGNGDPEEAFSYAGSDGSYTGSSYGSSFSTSTIKGILSMAAIYIDQDFVTYGGYTDELPFGPSSVYKDYCAQLYEASHVIAYDPNVELYYCDADGSDCHVASDACENCSIGCTNEEDARTGKYSVYVEGPYYVKDTKDVSDGLNEDGSTRYVTVDDSYKYYDILNVGPHGSYTYYYDNAQERNIAKAAMENRGCTSTNLIRFQTGKNEYTFCCGCGECYGHADLNVYALICNIYDPADEGDEDDHSLDTEKEGKYNLYAIDRYATAFDYNTVSEQLICDNPNEIIYSSTDENGKVTYSYRKLEAGEKIYPQNLKKEAEADGLTLVSYHFCPSQDMDSEEENRNPVIYSPSDLTPDEDGVYHCPECGWAMNVSETKKEGTNPGSDEDVLSATATLLHDDELYLIRNATGIDDLQIVDWWDGSGWFDNWGLNTSFYFLGVDVPQTMGVESFDELESPGEGNVVTRDSGGIPHRFSPNVDDDKRNHNFEQEGWTINNISLVRLLMASDWEELYGIKDFGRVLGVPLTDEEIAAIIANSPDLNSLCDDRKALITLALKLESVSQNMNYHYDGNRRDSHPSPSLVYGNSDVLTDLTYYNGAWDCSSYVFWLYAACGMPLDGLTSGNTDTLWDLYQKGVLAPVDLSNDTPLAGDIFLKYAPGGSNMNGNHAIIYAGGSHVSEARGSKFLFYDSAKGVGSLYSNRAAEILANSSYIVLRYTGINEDTYTVNANDSEETSDYDFDDSHYYVTCPGQEAGTCGRTTVIEVVDGCPVNDDCYMDSNGGYHCGYCGTKLDLGENSRCLVDADGEKV